MLLLGCLKFHKALSVTESVENEDIPPEGANELTKKIARK